MMTISASWWTAWAFLVAVAWILFRHFAHVLSIRGRCVPPGSLGCLPLVGETISFLQPHPSITTGSFLQNRRKRYGSIFSSHLFGQPTIVSCDPDLNAYVLQNEDRLFQSSYPKAIHGVLGEKSMLLIVGNAHKRIRSLGLKMISTAKTSTAFLNDIEKNALIILDGWSYKRNAIFCEEARKFTFNVMVKQILSLWPENPQTSQIFRDFNTFMNGLVSLPINIPGSNYAKAVQSRLRIYATVKTIMDERRKQNVWRGDFLDSLVTQSTLFDEEIQSLVLDLMFAAHETTSTLIALVLKFLSDCPTALQQFKSEHETIRRAKRKRNEEFLNLDDYTQMTFTQNVINETLRLGNVVKFVHRKALKDVKFKGYDIPAGWKVLPVLSAVHLDSSHYDNPLHFNPWRWHVSSEQELMMGRKFMPFGGGSRLCPGSELGKIETAFFFHHLVLNYRWRITEDDCSMAYPYVDFPKRLPIEVEQL